jgi:hypothetical protein
MLAISAASAVVSQQTQEDAANKQEQAVQDGLAKDRAATARQYQQIQESAMDEQAQLHTGYLIDSARIRAVAGESGLGGLSQERISQEAENNSQFDMATLERNRRNQNGQAHTSGLASATKGNIQLAGIQRPSQLGTGLQIAGAAASAYGSLSTPKAAAPKKAT